MTVNYVNQPILYKYDEQSLYKVLPTHPTKIQAYLFFVNATAQGGAKITLGPFTLKVISLVAA